MRKFLFYGFGIAWMVGFWLLIRWIVTGFSFDFGIGFAAGMFFLLGLQLTAKKLGYH